MIGALVGAILAGRCSVRRLAVVGVLVGVVVNV